MVHEVLALQLLSLFLTKPTEDSIELAAEFMQQCGQVLSEITQAGTDAIFQRFRTILYEGKISKRVQYVLEKLFQVRKDKFASFVGVQAELDLVEEADKITHPAELDMPLETLDPLDKFAVDADFEAHESEWDEIKKEIVGDYFELLQAQASGDEGQEEQGSADEAEVSKDLHLTQT